MARYSPRYHYLIFEKTGHTRAVLREYARNNDLINSTMPMAERNLIINVMIDNWSLTCTNPTIPANRKQSSLVTPCGIGLTILRTNEFFKPLSKAMFDLNSHTWLCEACYYKKYPKFKSTGWTSKLPKPKISNARAIFEKTGKRYNDENRYKHQLLPIFDKSKANHSLIQTREGPWIKYRCPHCDFYLCARAFQGWPEHQCQHMTTPTLTSERNPICPGGLRCDMKYGCAYNPPCPQSHRGE